MRYSGSLLLLFGVTSYIVGKHSKRLEIKTAAYLEDIDALVCDVNHNLHRLSTKKRQMARKQIDRINFFKEMPSEVSFKRLTSLQQIKVDSLNKEEVIAHATSSLAEYKFLVDEDENYIIYKTIIKDLESRDEIDKLKEYLKELYDEINQEKFSIGYGEAVLESLSHWSIPAMISLFVIGVNPLISEPYFQNE